MIFFLAGRVQGRVVLSWAETRYTIIPTDT